MITTKYEWSLTEGSKYGVLGSSCNMVVQVTADIFTWHIELNYG